MTVPPGAEDHAPPVWSRVLFLPAQPQVQLCLRPRSRRYWPHSPEGSSRAGFSQSPSPWCSPTPDPPAPSRTVAPTLGPVPPASASPFVGPSSPVSPSRCPFSESQLLQCPPVCHTHYAGANDCFCACPARPSEAGPFRPVCPSARRHTVGAWLAHALPLPWALSSAGQSPRPKAEGAQ